MKYALETYEVGVSQNYYIVTEDEAIRRAIMKLELNQSNLFTVSIIGDKLKYTRLINNKAVTIGLTV